MQEIPMAVYKSFCSHWKDGEAKGEQVLTKAGINIVLEIFGLSKKEKGLILGWERLVWGRVNLHTYGFTCPSEHR